MKSLLLLFIFFLAISCSESDSSAEPNVKKERINAEETFVPKYASWIESFRDFRAAVYQDDLEKIKTFFDFPIQSENNELWFFTKMGEEEMPDLSVPYTEKDFEDRYKSLFDKTFITAILKVKTDILFKKGEFETPKIFDGTYSWSTMYVSFNEKSKELNLTLYNEDLIYESNTEEEVQEYQVAEYSIHFKFKLDKDNRIKFKVVNMAG